MAENIKNWLKELGFNQNEQGVYLAILRLVSAPVIQIAKEAKVERTTTFRILQVMERRGLVERTPSRKRLQWKARHPRYLEEFVQKERQKKRQAIEKLLPELSSLFSQKEGIPQITYHEGQEAVLKIFQEMIRESKHRSELLIFSSAGAFFPALNKKEWGRLVNERISKQILSRILIPDLEGAPGYKRGEDWKNWRIVKLVDREKFPFKVTVNIAANKVYIIAVRRKIPVGVVIDDQPTTETFRMIFEICWGKSK